MKATRHNNTIKTYAVLEFLTVLTDEQEKEVLQAYEESEDDSNLIDDKDVWDELK